MSITLKNVFVHYDEGEALKGISINVTEGSIVTLIGSNGAGKTTTLRAIWVLYPLAQERFISGINELMVYRLTKLSAWALLTFRKGEEFSRI